MSNTIHCVLCRGTGLGGKCDLCKGSGRIQTNIGLESQSPQIAAQLSKKITIQAEIIDRISNKLVSSINKRRDAIESVLSTLEPGKFADICLNDNLSTLEHNILESAKLLKKLNSAHKSFIKLKEQLDNYEDLHGDIKKITQVDENLVKLRKFESEIEKYLNEPNLL